MNYDQARQRKDGKWHYTRKNDDRIYPIGFCANNCAGHDTCEEAEWHYWEWQLVNICTHNPVVDLAFVDGRQKCTLCGAVATRVASLPGIAQPEVAICDDHALQEVFPFHAGMASIHS